MNDSVDSASLVQRPASLYGALAIRLGFTSRERVHECLVLQGTMMDMGIRRRQLGEILLAKGYLTGPQQEEVSVRQLEGNELPRIPGYRILARIGKGATGWVFKAVQLSLDRGVAIKGLAPRHARNPASRQRFLHEAHVIARLNHPHIVQGIDVVEAEDCLYLVMEYIDGPTLGRILRHSEAFEESRALRIVAQVTSALHHAHSHGIIHRDIKPDNVMLTRQGVAKLCDLGLAKFRGVQREAGHDGRALLVGTPDYISPEQARGDRNVDTRSDIYSLGATLYQMVTGTLPFPGKSGAEVVSKHLSEPVRPPRQLNRLISPALEAMILRMMEKSCEDRFQTPRDLFREIERLRSDRLSSPPGTTAGGDSVHAGRSRPRRVGGLPS